MVDLRTYFVWKALGNLVAMLVWGLWSQAIPDPVAASSPCSKELPCFVSNSTMCFALRRRSCWVHHGADGESIPCSQQEPCCADAHCWWRHAPEYRYGLDGNGLFTTWPVLSLGLFGLFGFFFWVAHTVVARITFLEYIKRFVVLNVGLHATYPHLWFYLFFIPYFPHPQSLKSWSFIRFITRSVLLMCGGLSLGLDDFFADLVFGARWREGLVRNAEAAGGMLGAVPDAPTHWPALLRIPKSIETRMIQSTLVAPEAFICPLSLDLMRQPAITPRGTTYDREVLSRWVTAEGRYPAGEAASPLRMNQLAPNLIVRNLIQAWLDKQEKGGGKAKKGGGTRRKRRGGS